MSDQSRTTPCPPGYCSRSAESECPAGYCHDVDPVFGEDTPDQSRTTRDEPRIRHNLDRYHEAAETWRVYSHRARQARATMDDALACLRVAGGTKEAKRLTDG